MKNNLVEPIIITKPLREGGNYQEQFAPIFFIQRYDSDQDLAWYFEHAEYNRNAMYVTVFGESSYVNQLTELKTNQNLPLHSEQTIIRNTTLHTPGVERGVCPYGGYGRGASCYSINGKIYPGPTLPQREIYQQVATKLEI